MVLVHGLFEHLLRVEQSRHFDSHTALPRRGQLEMLPASEALRRSLPTSSAEDLELFTALAKEHHLELTPAGQGRMTIEMTRLLYPKEVFEQAMYQHHYRCERVNTMTSLRKQIDEGSNIETCDLKIIEDKPAISLGNNPRHRLGN